MRFLVVVAAFFFATSCTSSPFEGQYTPSDYCSEAADIATLVSSQDERVYKGYLYAFSGSTCFMDLTEKKVFTILSSSAPHAAQRKFLGLSHDLKTAYFMEITIENHEGIKNGFIIKKRPVSYENTETEVAQFFTTEEIFGATTYALDDHQIYIEYEKGKAVILDTLQETVRDTPILSKSSMDETWEHGYVDIEGGTFTVPLTQKEYELPEVPFSYDFVFALFNKQNTGVVLTFHRRIEAEKMEAYLVYVDPASGGMEPQMIAHGQYTYYRGFSDSDQMPNCLSYHRPPGIQKDHGIIQEVCQPANQTSRTVLEYNELTGEKVQLPLREGRFIELFQ